MILLWCDERFVSNCLDKLQTIHHIHTKFYADSELSRRRSGNRVFNLLAWNPSNRGVIDLHVEPLLDVDQVDSLMISMERRPLDASDSTPEGCSTTITTSIPADVNYMAFFCASPQAPIGFVHIVAMRFRCAILGDS
jgi:hypothetical protein